MKRFVPFVVFCAACSNATLGIDESDPNAGFGWADDIEVDTGDPDDPVEPDWSEYEDSEIRILEPLAGGFIPLGEMTTFRAGVRNGAGEILEIEDILWTSMTDTSWDLLGNVVDDDRLSAGEQEITATVELPNGDFLSHTIGGLQVQSEATGTYVGLFSADGRYQQLVFTCNGSAVLEVDRLGQLVTGSGDCLASTLGIDLPLEFIFDLQIDPSTGDIFGDAGVNLFLFTYDFPAEGNIDPGGRGIRLEWGGDVPILSDVVASMTAPRITREISN